MTRRLLPRLAVVAVGFALATTVTACAPAMTEDAASPPPPPAATSPTPTEAPTAESTPAADPACDTIIPATTVAQFEEVGWTSRQDAFFIGSLELEGGLQCVWGNFEVPTDQVQIFGWAPVDDGDARTAQQELLASGWIQLEEDDDGVYITEDPATARTTDDEGYGLTYLFGDGWVKFADTKQGILLVQWPPQ